MADFVVLRSSKDGPVASSGGGKMKSVSGIVVHHTGPISSVEATIDALINRTANGTPVGATYVMDRDGTVYRIVPDGSRTNHAAGYNSKYEGIEVLAKDDSDITPKQIAAFAKFADWHSSTYGYKVSEKTIIAHGAVTSYKRKTEGATLKWTYLQSKGFEVPKGTMVGDLGDGRPAMLFSDAPPWIRRPPANIPDVASEIDYESSAPKPMPYLTRFGAVLEIEKERAAASVAAREALYASNPVMYGIRASGVSPDELIMTDGYEYELVERPSGVVFDDRLMNSLLRSQDAVRADPIGAGPISWFPTDAAVGGIGSKALVDTSAAVGAINAAIAPQPSLTDKIDAGAGTWGDFTRAFDVPLGAPDPLTPTMDSGKTDRPARVESAVAGAAAPPVGEVEKIPAVANASPDPPLTESQKALKLSIYDGILPGIEARARGAAVLAETPTANTRENLDSFVRAVYSGIPVLNPKDEALSSPSLTRATTNTPASMLNPAPISMQAPLTAPKLTSSIIYDPKPIAGGGAFSTNYSAMAMAFDSFTLPASLEPKASVAPALRYEWEMFDTPEWFASPDRRDVIPKLTQKAEAATDATTPGKPLTTAAGTAKGAAATAASLSKPIVPHPSTATIKTTGSVAKVSGAAGGVAKASAAPVGAVSASSGVPASKPITRTIQVENPAYKAWEAKYGGGTVGGPGYDGIGKGLGSFDDFQKEMGVVTWKEAPTVPPAPARYITKTVEVPTPRVRPVGETSGSGSYTIQPGDTLSVIAKRAGISTAELARMNGISDPNKIIAGQKITVGGSSSIPVASTAKGTATATAAKTASTKSSSKSSSSASSSSVQTIKGSATGNTYEVGKIYVSSQGVQKMAMADGTFKTVK